MRALIKSIRFFERFAKPRLGHLLESRLSSSLFGLVVIALTVAAFVAPPFSGLDTLPALGVVLVSLGVLLEDIVVVAIGLAVGVAGVVVEMTLGRAAVGRISKLFH